MQEITYRSAHFFDEVAAHPSKHVHLILIATKPDIIKQLPLYFELKKRGHLVLLGHTGQHYSDNLSGGMLKEYDVEPDFNLNVRGQMHEIVSQIIGRLGWLIGELKEPTSAKAFPFAKASPSASASGDRSGDKSVGKRGKIVIPYVHGDTTTAMAASNAGFAHGFASVHVEAGIRTLTPNYKDWGVGRRAWDDNDCVEWRKFLMDRQNWERGSLEPFPEQFNTRCSEAATGVHLAPVELDREFLQGEGFPDDRIFVVGNSVVDAVAEAEGRMQQSTVFERYPLLADGDFVRFCIHRRENCGSDTRFRAIYDTMVSLIKDGRNLLLITMTQTERAFERMGLKKEVEALAKKHKNFIYSPVWAEYVDVMAAMTKAAVCATDSGSMQEEMNAMGIPCVTLRFGSDRSESAMAGGNLIAPPMDAAVIKKMIEFAWNNKEMRKAPKLYGKNVSAKCIDAVEQVLKTGEVFRSDEERLAIA
ncbi:MAG: UDP-N-acetylglucosamine 2-epimerase [Candidatus Peribacteraceae bacterium]|jgi:UDP-N-acetylglucosamine 2-epimerase (non-hydrolysing)|nr:UDP-N-acetylglucosamine 2-epimerase [Candidatus Peribacteraceae bacterium]